MDRPGSVQADIHVGRLAVTRSDPDFFPLMVGQFILGGGASSRMFMNIREKQGFAYDAHAELTPRRDTGIFSAVTQVRNEVLQPAMQAVLDELTGMVKAQVPDEELARTKNFLNGIYLMRLETQGGLANQLMTVKLMGLPNSYLEQYTARIRAVTPAEIQRARRALHESRNRRDGGGGRRQYHRQAAGKVRHGYGYQGQMKITSSKKVYECKLFQVTEEEARDDAAGFTIHRSIVRHGGSAVMMAVDEHDRVLLVRQFRLPAGEYLWELPAGRLDPGEQPLEAAQRELVEETGYRAESWKELVSYWPSPGFRLRKDDHLPCPRPYGGPGYPHGRRTHRNPLVLQRRACRHDLPGGDS